MSSSSSSSSSSESLSSGQQSSRSKQQGAVLFWESEQNKNFIQQLIDLDNKQEQVQLICENPQLQMKALGMTPNRFLESINQFKEILQKPVSEYPVQVEWHFPEHLRDLKHQDIYEGFKEWFENECKPIKVRRSALVVYGKRNLGKTLFAWSLTQELGTNGEILDKTRAIHVKNCFTNEQFKNQDKAQLLILDDIKYKKPFNQELWKQLMSGQATANQEDKYCNINYEGGKPVIFLTNNRKTYTFFASNPDFENEAYFIDIGNTYIGPPNTKPQIKPKENRVFGRKRKLMKEVEKAKQKQKLSNFFLGQEFEEDSQSMQSSSSVAGNSLNQQPRYQGLDLFGEFKGNKGLTFINAPETAEVQDVVIKNSSILNMAPAACSTIFRGVSNDFTFGLQKNDDKKVEYGPCQDLKVEEEEVVVEDALKPQQQNSCQ